MKTYDYYLKNIGEVGYVKAVMHSMIYAAGLPTARIAEIVVTETGQRGIVQSLLTDTVEILMLDGRPVRHGTAIARTNEILRVPVGDHLLGRSVDAFVNPIDGKAPFPQTATMYDFENPAPPIYKRSKIDEPFHSGVKVVDMLIPLGRGQRELVIGDQKSGKTAFLMQSMITQAALGTICIYTAIGKKKAEIKRIEEYFATQKIGKNTIIVAADASSPASFIYIAPFTATSIAEYFREKGQEVLLIFDDLNKHAKVYREIALLSKKSPGREAYPGDIFYLHSHLLERAGKKALGDNKAAAITALAVIETVGGDFTGYIQTNAMSITDGHIFFDIETFNQGARPAVNVPLSVSRVGRQTQSKLDKDFTNAIATILSDFTHAQGFARFGVELNEKTRTQLDMGEKANEIFQQENTIVVPKFLTHLYFGLLLEGFWAKEPKQAISRDKALLAQAYVQGKLAPLEQALAQTGKLEDYRGILRTYLVPLAALTRPGTPQAAGAGQASSAPNGKVSTQQPGVYHAPPGQATPPQQQVKPATKGKPSLFGRKKK